MLRLRAAAMMSRSSILAWGFAAILHAAPPGSGWVLSWSDEFSGGAVDSGNWSVGNGWSEPYRRSGRHAARLNTSNNARGVEQTIRGLKPAAAYTVSMWHKGNSQPVRLGVKHHGHAESFTAGTAYNHQWKRAAHRFSTGASSTSAVIFAMIPAGSNIAAVDIDDFLLVEDLPAPWDAVTVGTPHPGEAGASDERLVVRGAGNNLGSSSDAFHFLHQSMSGSGSVTVRLLSFEAHHGRAKAGLMLRASPHPGAPFAMVHWLPDGQCEFLWRGAQGAASTHVWASGPTAWPPRLNLLRTGGVIRASFSTDGVAWTPIGEDRPIDLPDTVLAGLAVTSHDSASVADAVFSEFSIAGGGPSGAPDFVRGDANADGTIDIADAIFTLGYLFAGGPEPACLKAADANDDGAIDLADAITILSHLFAGAGPLPAPFPACGADPTPDGLSCARYEPCP